MDSSKRTVDIPEEVEIGPRGVLTPSIDTERTRQRPCKRNENWMKVDMRRATRNRNEAKRLDAMIALPLERFRRALTDLTSEELAALEARIAVQNVKSRWARGGHGVARHRSVLELGLLARRQDETRREREARRGALAQLRLVEPAPQIRELATADLEERAA